jgi:uncharacterized protein (DUF2164 family)
MVRLTGEARAQAVTALKLHFKQERSEDLGDLAAGFLLDWFADNVGPHLYNQGVRDAKARVLQSQGSLNEELDVLEVVPKPAKAGKRS